MYIYNAKIDTVTNGVIPHGYVRTEDGRIAEVSEGEPPCISAEDIDCGGCLLMPGLIDSHSHIGLIGDGQGSEGEDVNEDTDPITPHLRTIDGLCFNDGYFHDAVKTG
ncbi:MAG: amidohydrolase, partial [Oscillospiraceae bacterium]